MNCTQKFLKTKKICSDGSGISNPKCLAYCYLTQYFCLISDFKNWVKKLFLAYFYRSFSLPHNIAVRRPILKFKTIFYIYIQFSFILYKINFLYLHYFWVKIAFEVRRSDFVIVFLKQVLRLYSWNQSAALEVGISRNKFVYSIYRLRGIIDL